MTIDRHWGPVHLFRPNVVPFLHAPLSTSEKIAGSARAIVAAVGGRRGSLVEVDHPTIPAAAYMLADRLRGAGVFALREGRHGLVVDNHHHLVRVVVVDPEPLTEQEVEDWIGHLAGRRGAAHDAGGDHGDNRYAIAIGGARGVGPTWAAAFDRCLRARSARRIQELSKITDGLSMVVPSRRRE